MAYALGIDTGGTFTDAVLLNATRQVVAASKSTLELPIKDEAERE